eukprot:m.123369 g.123369  ORF g.123369 m.123369 type:complete len:204 (-) comp9646_c0_seq4:64-675(-)
MISSTFKLMVTTEMLMLSFLIMYSGVELAFWSSKYQSVLQATFTYRESSISGIVIGVAEIVGGMTMGRLGDKAGMAWVVVVMLLVHVVTLYLIYLNILTDKLFDSPSNVLALCCSFGLGLGDSAVNTALYTTLGEKYKDSSLQAFALFKFFQSATAGIAFAYAGRIALDIQLLILGLFLVVGSFMYLRVVSVRNTTSGYARIN